MTPPELDALQSLFARAVRHPAGVDAFLADADADTRAAFDAAFDESPGFDRRARLTVYADAYFWRLHDVLLDHFSLIAWLLGPARFRNLATDYVLHRPSVDPDIRRFGARLPAFVATHAEQTRAPGLAELAAIEWAMVRALDIPHPAVCTAQTLAAMPPERWPQLELRAVPSGFVGPCHHDFPTLWDRHRTTDAPASPPPPVDPTHVLVWRQHHDVMHRVVDPSEAVALAQLQQGVAFAALCEDADAATAAGWLLRWVADGLVAAPAS